MDRAKQRLFIGVGAVIFGVLGASCLLIALTLVLAATIGLIPALFSLGGTLFVVAALLLLIVIRPDTSTEEEVAKMESLTADALADLPFDTLKAVIEKRPMASLTLAATTGYALTKDPETALKNFRRVVTGLI